MACLEHACVDCNWGAFNNRPGYTGGVCPNCGGRVVTHFDEAPERDEPREARDDDDE